MLSTDRLAKILSAILLVPGVLHFLAPKPFDSIVPEELPGDARAYTYASGVAEVGIGAALLVPRWRRRAAGLAALLFTAVFPANVNMVRLWQDKGPLMKAKVVRTKNQRYSHVLDELFAVRTWKFSHDAHCPHQNRRRLA